MKISLIILIRNEAHKIADIIRRHYNYLDEILFLENGSIDNTRKILKSIELDKVRSLFLHHDYIINNGYSAIRNFGIEKASGDWIMYLDSDMYILPDKIITVIDNIKRANDDNKIVFSTKWQGYSAYMNKTRNDIFDFVRTFKKIPQIFYSGFIHNEIVYGTPKEYKTVASLGEQYKRIYPEVSILHKQNTWEDPFFKELRKTMKAYIWKYAVDHKDVRGATNSEWFDLKKHDYNKNAEQAKRFIELNQQSYEIWTRFDYDKDICA